MKRLLCFFIALLSITSVYAAHKHLPTEKSTNAPYALIAGGSKGIGYGIATALAERGYNLILIARTVDTLQKAKTELEETYHVHVDILSYDLSKRESATDIAA